MGRALPNEERSNAMGRHRRSLRSRRLRAPPAATPMVTATRSRGGRLAGRLGAGRTTKENEKLQNKLPIAEAGADNQNLETLDFARFGGGNAYAKVAC